MGSITDTVVVICLSIFFAIGAFKGFIYSLIGPVSLTIGVIASFFYYSKTNNIFIALVISIFAPIILNILFLISYGMYKKYLAKESFISWLSRLGGAIFSVLWSGAMLGLTLVLITLIPLNNNWLNIIKSNITQSRSYAFIDAMTGDKITSATKDLDTLLVALENPQMRANLEKNEEIKDLINDESLQSLMQDEMTRQQIVNKDFPALMKNEKFKAVMGNKDLAKKLLSLEKAIISGEMNLPKIENEPEDSPEEPQETEETK